MIPPDQVLKNSLGLWWRNTPPYQDHRVGCFSAPSTSEELMDAENHLRSEGCTLAIGPMEGNTWQRHRVVTETDGSPPFLLEPTTPPSTADLLRQAGYEVLSRYSSSLIDLTSPPPDLDRLRRRLAGLTIRTLDLNRLEEELRAIYQLSIHAFRDNFLYTPIGEQEFLAQYLAFQSQLTPECAFLAEDRGSLVGFVFGYPDRDRFVVKTLAVLPERRFGGLGTLLVERLQDQARRDGFTRAIHALQREDNTSLRISSRFQATPFRRYALFAKPL